jgi:cytochrome c oxidase subunit II
MSESAAAPSMQQGDHHFRNIVLLWLLSNVIMLPIVIWVLGPGLPPGNGSVQAHGQVVDNIVLFSLATPVAMGVLVYFGYALWAFRERTPDVIVDGPAIRGNATVQFWWLATTITLVLFLAGYGTDRLLVDGAGGGQGPNPISVPKAPDGHKLTVQVIAQQWEFTYRYPAYGGVETRFLELPENTLVRFDVTSLDVIHSFWAYQLGVKADATPGENNVAFATTLGALNFNVRCAELCGVWHGYMFNNGSVVPKAQFATWIAQQQSHYAPATKNLGPVSKTYFPVPLRRGG